MWVIDACHTSLESAVGAQYISMPATSELDKWGISGNIINYTKKVQLMKQY